MNLTSSLFLVFLVSVTNMTKTKSLKSATDKLAELARVTNGFTVQSELTKDPKLFSAITSELLGIGSTTLLDTLLAFNATDVSEDLNALFDGIQKATISKVDTVQVGNKINAIKLMTDKVDDLTKGIAVNVTEVKEKLANATPDFSYSNLDIPQSFAFSESLSTMLTKKIIARSTETTANGIMLQMIKNGMTKLGRALTVQGDVKVLGRFWELKDTYESVLKPIMGVSEIAKQYNKNVLKPEVLAGDLDLMVQDVKSLANLLTLSQKDTNGAQMVKVVQEIEASLNLVSTRSRTLGFMNGVSDIQLLFKDLKGEWLKKNIGNGQSIAKLVPKLEKLKTFAEKVVPLESSWSKLSNDSTSRDAAKTVSDLLHQAQVSSKSVQNTAALTKSFENIRTAVASLKPAKLHQRLGDFEKFCLKFEEFDQTIAKMESLFETVKNSEYVTKLTGLTQQINQLIGLSENDAVVDKEVKDLRALQDITEIAAFLNKTMQAWKSIDFDGIDKILVDTAAWDLAKEIQTSLGDTGLLKALADIKDLKFDAQATDSFVKFADNIRTIQSKSAEVTETKTFLTELSTVVTTGNKAKSSMQTTKEGTRSRRQPTVRLDSHVAHQLGTAVQVLQNMAVVSEKKTKVIGLADAKASVTAAVVAVAQDVWTDGNRAAMKNTVVEVEKLEKFVQGLPNDDWDTLVKVFDEAAKVKGAPIDTKKFADPIGESLAKSTDADVKAAAVEFRDLSALELDFASKEKDLKTASLTLNPIRAFFDQVLGISRIQGPQTLVTQEPGSDLWTYLTPTLASLLSVILALVLSFVFWKRREARLKQEYQAELAKQHKQHVEEMEKMLATAKKNKEEKDLADIENDKQLKKRNKENEDLKKQLVNAQGQLVDAKGQLVEANEEARANQIDFLVNEEAAKIDGEVANAAIAAALLERNRGYLKVYANRGVFFFNQANELRGVVANKTNCVFKAVEAADHENLTELITRGDPLDVFMLHNGELVTPLILACRLKDLNSMTLLLMAGANPILLGSDGKSAERVLEFALASAKRDLDRDEKDRFFMVRWRKKKRGRDRRYDYLLDKQQLLEKMILCFTEYQTNAQIQKNLPDLLPIGKYNFAVDQTRATLAFRNKFQARIHSGYPRTHRISSTEVYELEPTVASLTNLFEPQPLLKPSYMTACMADPKAIGDDYLHRVTELKWKEKVYDIVETLKFYALGHMIPPMFGVYVTYFGDGDMTLLARHLGFTLRNADKSTMHQHRTVSIPAICNGGGVNWFVYGPEGKERAQQEFDQVKDKGGYGFYSIEEVIDKLLESYKKVDLPMAHKGNEAEIAEFIQTEKAQREAEWEKMMEVKKAADEEEEKKEKALHKKMDNIRID